MLVAYFIGGMLINYLYNKQKDEQKGGRTRNKTVTLNGEEYDVDKILEYYEKNHRGGPLNIKKIRSTFINKDKKNYDPDNTLLYIWERNGVKWHGKNPNVLKVLENLKSKN